MNIVSTQLAYEFTFTDPWRGFSRRCLSAGDDAFDFREQGYRFPHVRLASTFTRPLPPLLVDLLDVAVAVYLADRLAPRRLPGRKHGGQAHPRRDIHVRLPVSDPAFWSAGEVGTLLGDALRFLTGDSWEFTFGPIFRPAAPGADQQEYLFDLPPDRSPRLRHFGAGIAETFSCDRYPNYHEQRSQCGQCPSCVLRRLSLEAAGLADLDPNSGYCHDVKDPFTPLSPAAAFVLDKFDAQAHRLRDLLNAERPWAALSRAYPELSEVQAAICQGGDLAPAEVEFGLRRLLGEHAAEWRAFSGARTLTRHFQAAA